MAEPIPILLVPGLSCSPRLYAPQLAPLWRFGPVTVADHTRDETIAAIATRILAAAPPRFALAGLSMGGYIAFEIVRQAPDRVLRLALLDTSARPDTQEATEMRHQRMAMAEAGKLAEVADALFPFLVHPRRRDDEALCRIHRTMTLELGPAVFVRQQNAIIGRIDSRPTLPAVRCPTLVLVGDADQLTPPALAQEMAAGIADAALVVVPECGHASTLEQPEAVTAALVEWLEG